MAAIMSLAGHDPPGLAGARRENRRKGMSDTLPGRQPGSRLVVPGYAREPAGTHPPLDFRLPLDRCATRTGAGCRSPTGWVR